MKYEAAVDVKHRSHILALFGCLALAVMTIQPTAAVATSIPVYNLDVTYTDGSGRFAPGSFGLSSLPLSVSASFVLGAGREVIGGATKQIEFDITDVISANLAFGDAVWTLKELTTFSGITNGVFTPLFYGFGPIDTPSVVGGIVLNFPLAITGTTKGGEAFEYNYAKSTQTLAAVPEPSTILLLGTGLLGLAGYRWHQRRRERSQVA